MIARLVGGYQVVTGGVGLVLVIKSAVGLPQTVDYASQTGQLGIALANVVVTFAFLGFFSLALVGGVNAWRERPGRVARLLPFLLMVQAPVVAAPGFQFFIALLPPQVGVMFLPTGNVRAGLFLELSPQFNLAFDADVAPQAVMVNVLPLALLAAAVLAARDSVLFARSTAPVGR